MGMFDTIRIYSELFPEELRGKEFQTQELECRLMVYEIHADNRLYEVDLIDPVDTNWHGEFDVYTILNPADINTWVEFKLRFTDGFLVRVEKVSESE